MKYLLVATVVVLAFVSSAYAQTVYWTQKGNTYTCSGIRTGVVCKETDWQKVYKIRILPSFVIVQYGGKVIFSCERGFTPAGNCTYFGR